MPRSTELMRVFVASAAIFLFSSCGQEDELVTMGALVGCYVDENQRLSISSRKIARIDTTEFSVEKRRESGVDVLILQPKAFIYDYDGNVLVQKGNPGSFSVLRIDRDYFGISIIAFKETGGFLTFKRTEC